MSTDEVLHFIGSGSAFNPEMDNTSAWFCQNGMFFLLDCGETVFGKIWNLPAFETASRIVVLLTHMHSDHVGSIGTLLSYCAMVVHKSVDIYYPSSALVPYLSMVGIKSSFYTQYVEIPKEWGIEVSPYPVEHAKDMDCFGYVLTLGGRKVYYSGDAADIPDEVLQQFLSGLIEHLYQDTCMEVSEHHCPLSLLEQRIPKEHRSRVSAMHISSKQSMEIIKEKGFQVVSV
ncbi:MAG: MBL fold metallo-hydrolase [Clostridia bacterium]|nr:MBL fold metallo-hydrolase [Clostridia bacterium]